MNIHRQESDIFIGYLTQKLSNSESHTRFIHGPLERNPNVFRWADSLVSISRTAAQNY